MKRKTVNERIYRKRLITEEEQSALMEVLQEEIQKPVNGRANHIVKDLAGNNSSASRIKINKLGIIGATELVGRLGIFLAGIEDDELAGILAENRRRHYR